MIEHYFIIETLDGRLFDSRNYNIKIREILIPSVYYEDETESVPGRPDFIDMGATARRGDIVIEFDFISEDLLDFPLLRNTIFKMSSNPNPFFITESREPGKKYKVRSKSYTPNQILTIGRTSLPLKCLNAFAESRLRSSDDWTIDSEKIQYGMGLSGNYDPIWRYYQNAFVVYNPGDETINPNYHDLLITIQSESTNMVIRNHTTKQTVEYRGTTTYNDILRLEPGCRVTKNHLSVLGNISEGTYISLAPGPNEIELLNTTGDVEVILDTPFYYY